MATIVEKIKAQPEKTTPEIRSTGVYDIDFGFGEGVNLIFNDYIGFGQYILTDRHIPQIGDGLKNVQRSSIYSELLAEKGQKNPNYRKSSKLSGDVMNDWHPHGDGSIYKAFSRMTEANGSSKIPLFDGSGNHGDKESTDPAGALRYTDIRSHSNAKRLLEDIDGLNMIESRATERLEIPEDLNSPYPYAFVGLAQDGTAIGLATSTAIYDVNEVADLIQGYLKTGKMKAVLAPDFVNGCYVVQNTKEFKKLMTTGRAKVKTRGKVEIRGKELFLTNFPYGVKKEHLIKEINELNIPRTRAYDGTTFGERKSVRVMCSTKKDTQEVLNQIYLKTSFQKNINFSCRYLDGTKLLSIGLYDGIKTWVSKRKSVLSKKFNLQLASLRESLKQYSPLVRLIQDKDAHRKFMTIFGDIDRPESDAANFLREFGCDDKAVEFIMGRTMRSLRTGGIYISKYEGLQFSIKQVEDQLADLSQVIYQQMDEMKRDWGKYKRVSEVTMEDFVKIEREDVPVETTVVVENNLISRMDGVVLTSSNAKAIKTRTDKNIVVGLSDGSIQNFRVKDLAMGSATVVGEPINNVGGSLHDVIFIEEAQEGKELYIYYKNGNLSFVDLTPYTRTTNISRLKIKQLPVKHLPYVSEVGIWNDEVAKRVTIQLSNWEASWMSWGEVKHKASSAVSRLIVPKESLTALIAQRYEVEGEWYMDEKYHRPRPVRIASEIVEWNLTAYIENLREEANKSERELKNEEIKRSADEIENSMKV